MSFPKKAQRFRADRDPRFKPAPVKPKPDSPDNSLKQDQKPAVFVPPTVSFNRKPKNPRYFKP